MPTPTRNGYTFNGWYTAASGGTKAGNAGASYTPTKATTLYAQWSKQSYTITYYLNGGTGATAPNSATVDYNGSHTTASTTAYKAGTKTGYQVTFNSNGGT